MTSLPPHFTHVLAWAQASHYLLDEFITPAQSDLPEGSYVVTFDSHAKIHIYGWLEADDEGEPRPTTSKHLRHGRWYSQAEPDGEWGYRHASTFDAELTPLQWVEVSARGWPASFTQGADLHLLRKTQASE